MFVQSQSKVHMEWRSKEACKHTQPEPPIYVPQNPSSPPPCLSFSASFALPLLSLKEFLCIHGFPFLLVSWPLYGRLAEKIYGATLSRIVEDLVESHAKRLHPDCLHREKEASLRHTFSNLSIFCCGEPTLSVSLSAALNTSEFPNGEPFCQTCHIPSSLFIPFPHPPATPALEPPPLALPRLPSACLRHSIKCSFLQSAVCWAARTRACWMEAYWLILLCRWWSVSVANEMMRF